jgi:hypothetical protein
MQPLKRLRPAVAVLSLATLFAACSDNTPSEPVGIDLIPTSCPGINLGPAPARITLTPGTPAALLVKGNGRDTVRHSAEIAVRGNLAYLSSWSVRQVQGNKVSIWDVSGNVPVLVDSLIVPNATTTGDVAVSDDGSLLVVATERSGGAIVIYDLADPRKPRLLSRFNNANTDPGVHTAEIGRVNGKLYAFLSIDIGSNSPAKLVIVDLSTPSAPREVYSKVMGNPFVHDTFVRSGLLFVGLWDDGVQIWDIGGCGTGATPEAPRTLGTLRTVGGQVHNIWWYHDPSGSKRYAFIGQEGSASLPTRSSGDIHVVDLSDPTAPKEVAFYHVEGAGAHNFSVDEANGVLYAAFYNGGVRALDVRGDLGTCEPSQQSFNATANLFRCDLRLTGREIGVGLLDLGPSQVVVRNSSGSPLVSVWGVQHLNGNVYASDMVNGIWKLGAAK